MTTKEEYDRKYINDEPLGDNEWAMRRFFIILSIILLIVATIGLIMIEVLT
jgi:hypothetical protein